MKNKFNQSFVHLELVRDKKPGPVITKPIEAIAVIKAMLGKMDREYFMSIHLSARNSVTGIEVVSVGILNASMVHPREVFKAAILNSSASIILVHNHPSFDLTPSDDDLKLTKRLIECGKLLGIEVLDHIITGNAGDEHFSMQSKGLIKQEEGSYE
ncbi:MAG: hypothetical protein A2252_09155 [Elusimicrobia bacterium RIFOXYA2_FULL_39_19]|nr:MAG: hypothetical protein A2252_09155 [Elusimicrobia bacterium RIFOXYA2_FULL_39_19]